MFVLRLFAVQKCEGTNLILTALWRFEPTEPRAYGVEASAIDLHTQRGPLRRRLRWIPLDL